MFLWNLYVTDAQRKPFIISVSEEKWTQLLHRPKCGIYKADSSKLYSKVETIIQPPLEGKGVWRMGLVTLQHLSITLISVNNTFLCNYCFIEAIMQNFVLLNDPSFEFKWGAWNGAKNNFELIKC